MSAKLFKQKPDAEKRTIRCPIMLTAAEDQTISAAAAIRQLTKSDYFRRTALGRRADVRYEEEIVLKLSALVQAIRSIHTDLLERGISPSAEGFRPVIQEALAAILRIQK